jgi:hypothetical protein
MKRHGLILDQNILLIKGNYGGNDFSVRQWAENISISKSSAASILTRRAEYQNDYLTNTNKIIERKLKDDTSR